MDGTDLQKILTNFLDAILDAVIPKKKCFEIDNVASHLVQPVVLYSWISWDRLWFLFTECESMACLEYPC